MRRWAQWTAKTALLAAGFAAAGGLSGVALAAGGSASSDAGPGLSGIHALLAWLLLYRVRMCGLGV
jgi:hypothetical protein